VKVWFGSHKDQGSIFVIERDTHDRRMRAADAATAYRAKRITWQEFMNEFGESKDDKIWDLVDLIEHEPARGGLRGIGEKAWFEYEDQLDRAIKALRDAHDLTGE
jgi:hypothetical protein